jgi:cytidine deaminase
MTDAVVAAARAALANAHAPYSRFRVGAALEAEDGRVFVGANVENASYGLTNCAERVALGAAVVAGARRFRRIVVVTESNPPAAPCGACRQALAEFGLDTVVEAVGDTQVRHWRLGDLLPDAFGPADLESG